MDKTIKKVQRLIEHNDKTVMTTTTSKTKLMIKVMRITITITTKAKDASLY